MPIHRALLIAFSLAGSLLTAACGGGAADASPIAPGAVLVSSREVAPLTVQVDRICDGQESQIRVFIDAQSIGMTNPGEAGVRVLVTVGEHKLSAISQRGTQWGPYPTVVTSDGDLERLGCMPPPSPPDAI
jgi:hypothetical protein